MRVGYPRPCVLAAALATCAWLASAAAAHAAIPSVFNGTATPVPCAVQADGVRLCDESTFVPARPRSTVKSFDGVPIDVRVAFPRQPTTGPDGPYPLVMEFHRYADRKLALAGDVGVAGPGLRDLHHDRARIRRILRHRRRRAPRIRTAARRATSA